MAVVSPDGVGWESAGAASGTPSSDEGLVVVAGLIAHAGVSLCVLALGVGFRSCLWLSECPTRLNLGVSTRLWGSMQSFMQCMCATQLNHPLSACKCKHCLPWLVQNCGYCFHITRRCVFFCSCRFHAYLPDDATAGPLCLAFVLVSVSWLNRVARFLCPFLQVILSTHAVVANGGLIALNGSHAVALAANDLSVPVVCVTGLFKVKRHLDFEGVFC